MKSKKIAYLFPGQGAQYPGMGKEFAESFSIAKETFEEADEILQENVTRVIFEGPKELLTKTQYSQVGIFITSVAIFRAFQEQLPELVPSICAGLSLGEYTALFASERLSFQETLFLVRERARLMNEACERTVGTMAAVLGLASEDVEKAILGISGVWIANYNSPGQIVISGTKPGIEKASALLKEKGAKRVLPLEVHGAFHSPLMESAEKGLAPFIQKALLQDSNIQFVMNVPGDFVQSLGGIQQNLIRQVTHSVRWEQGVKKMEGIELFLEMGPGKTLTGLNKKIGTSAQTFSIEKPADLDQIGALCSSY